MRLGGALAWLLAAAACHHGAAPQAPSCAAAADHVRALLGPGSPRASRIRDAFAARCEADGWSDDARDCVVATTSLSRPRHCKARLSPQQRAALDRALVAVDGRPARPLPPACREYGAAVEQLGACTGMSEGARGALELAYRNLTRAWQRGTYDTEAVELQCRAMLDGLRQAIAARCGW